MTVGRNHRGTSQCAYSPSQAPSSRAQGGALRARFSALLASLLILLGAGGALAQSATKLAVSNITTPQSAGAVSTVKVVAQTSGGSTVPGYRGTIAFTSTDSQALLPASYTFTSADSGVHVFTNGVTLKTAGTQSVTANDTVSGIIGSQAGISVTALGMSGFVLNVPPRLGTYPVGSSLSATVTAADIYGNRISGYRGRIHFTSTDARAVLPADYTFASADAGSHSWPSGSVILHTSGTQSITVTDTANSALIGSQTMTVVAGAASSLGVSGIASPRTANSAGSVTVEARDTYGNRATGYRAPITFTSSDSHAILPGFYTFTASDNGIHTFTNGVTLKTVGTQSVTATDASCSLRPIQTICGPLPTGTQSGIVVTSSVPTHYSVTGIPSPSTAGAPASVTVTALDGSGSVVSSYTGTVHFSSTDAQATLPSNYTFVSGDAGSHTFTNAVTVKTAGTQSVTATDTVTSTITGGQTGIQVNAAGAATLAVSGVASPTTAGASASATVRALDAYGNQAGSYLGTIHFTSTDAQATMPANYAFVAGDAGSHTFTTGVVLKTSGTQSVTATDTVTSTVTGGQTGIRSTRLPLPRSVSTASPRRTRLASRARSPWRRATRTETSSPATPAPRRSRRRTRRPVRRRVVSRAGRAALPSP